MKWYVYYYNVNHKTIEKYNIFDHGGFRQDIENIFKNDYSKDDFNKELETSLLFYFWSKAEWEILLLPWVGGSPDDKIKIDAYDQIMINFDQFSDYVWKEYALQRMLNHEKERLRELIENSTEDDVQNICNQVDCWGITSLTEDEQYLYDKYINDELWKD